MYEGIKKATGPPTSKIVPLKSKTGEVIKGQGKQLQRWVEHYLELYATQNIVTDTAIDAIPDLPVMEELDTPPTLEEHRKTINCLVVGRPLGVTASPLKSLRSGNQHYSNPCTNSSTSAGDKDTSPRTCVMQTLSPCTRTKETAVTATTTEAYTSSESLERLSPVSAWHACRP
ncbi:RNA-directed DNA polymerase from mobile element jockey-like [Tachysurus ichikawai]